MGQPMSTGLILLYITGPTTPVLFHPTGKKDKKDIVQERGESYWSVL